MQKSKKTLEMDPNFAIGHYELGQALEQKHMHDEAISEFQRAIELSGHSGAFDSNLGYAYAVSGRKEEAIKIVNDLEARHDQNPSADADIALIYVGLGDRDQAMNSLNKAKAPPDERGGYRYVRPTATAPHLDSTQPSPLQRDWRRSAS